MAVNIPQFRYIEGYKDYVAEIKQEVEELMQLVEQHRKVLASALTASTQLSAAATNTFTINLTPDDADAKSRMRRLAKKFDTDLVKVVVPNVASLEKHYTVCEELYEKYRTLEAVESQISTRFEGRGSASFRKELTMLKSNVEQALKKTFATISAIAHKHVPASFQKYMTAISDEVNEHVHSSKTELMLYVNTTSSGSLVFTYYMSIEDAIQDDGSITPMLYVVLQWIVGSAKEDPSNKVYLLHTFETPNEVTRQGGGIEVSSVMSAVRAVGNLLSLEHFSTELGVVPLSLAFLKDPAHIDRSLFSARDLISKLTVTAQDITFTIKAAVPKSKYAPLATELYTQVRQLLRNQRSAKLRMRILSGQRQIVFTSVTEAQGGEISLHDAEFLKERFGVSDTQLRKIVNVLNNG